MLTELIGPMGPARCDNLRVDFHVTLGDRGDLAAQIYRQVLGAILDGRLRAGERLPASRELARQLEVSRNTVAVAYDRLSAEGYLTGRVGAGTYVCTVAGIAPRPHRSPPRRTPADPAAGVPEPARPGGVRPRAIWTTVPRAEIAPRTLPPYDFAAGVPDIGLFPFEAWRRIIARELRPSAIQSGDYGDPQGHAGLRAAITRHSGLSRAVRAGPDDVVVTQGAQQALDLIGRVLIEPGACVAVEEPGYPPARHLFHSLGARVVGVPVDDEGLVVDALPKSARLVYVTPSHQFPLGTVMSLARRTALLNWAERRGAVIIEDDYDSEFRYSDRPLEPLQSIDRSGRVIYVGSFSKTMLPMLRIGFLVAPATLRSALGTAKQLTDWHGESLTQATLARFIDEGQLARHLRRARRVYGDRRERLVSWFAEHRPGGVALVPSSAGLHVCVRLDHSDVDGVAARAAALGVSVRPLARYCHAEPGETGLVIGFGAIPADRIVPGLERLAQALVCGQ
jgi:GntR family transcriptional regulator/MocR family aminotransferase